MNRRQFLIASIFGVAASTVLPLVGRRYTPTLDWLDAAWRREVTGRWASAHPWGMSVSPQTFYQIEREMPAMWRFSKPTLDAQRMPNLCWRGCTLRPSQWLNDGTVLFRYKDSQAMIKTREQMIGGRTRTLPIRWFNV